MYKQEKDKSLDQDRMWLWNVPGGTQTGDLLTLSNSGSDQTEMDCSHRQPDNEQISKDNKCQFWTWDHHGCRRSGGSQ